MECIKVCIYVMMERQGDRQREDLNEGKEERKITEQEEKGEEEQGGIV